MKIDNGRRARLVVPGVFDGDAGVVGNRATFVPNRYGDRPNTVRGGLLDGAPVLLAITKDENGPFWTARYEVIP